MSEITKEHIRQVETTMRKFKELYEMYHGFQSTAFPNGDFNENTVRELAAKKGTSFDSLVHDLYDYTKGRI